jgi:D-inositol-3-phosphate glycosyltransferase
VIERVAYLSVHTSPLAVPGSGDAGGMNVYIHELAQTMAARGVEVDVFTRRAHPDDPAEVEIGPRYRVIGIEAGDADPIGAGDPGELVGAFAEGVVKWAAAQQVSYDVVHSHYWLSGWAGVLLQEVLGVPLAISFHTLGRVKDANRRPGERATSLLRIAAETEVIARAGCVVSSTPSEAAELIQHYSANPERLCVSPPGVDHDRFRPGSRQAARAELGLGPGRLLLFVGRLQPLKGPDVALDAFLRVADDLPDVRLLMVGGPSGPDGEDTRRALRDGAAATEHAARIGFLPARPHHELPDLYRAADVVVVPSRSESFGLVAAEAQACGIPVVAARAGGLAHAVADGESGILVDGWDPADYAASIRRILEDPDLAAGLSSGAAAHAERFSWPATADRLLELYRGIAAG